MEWYYWAAALIGVVIAIKFIRRSSKDFSAATNAILAEHYLSTRISDGSDFSTRLGASVEEVMCAGGFPGMERQMIERMFNQQNRFAQLNVIALALERMGLAPDVPNEFWCPIRNPFALTPNNSDLNAVAGRLRAMRGVSLSVKSTPFQLSGGRLTEK